MSHVYLAGPISGLSYDETIGWRDYALRVLSDLGIEARSPMRNKNKLEHYVVVSPDQKGYDEFGSLYTNQGITARDRYDTMNASVVLMNLTGAKKISIGTMIEAGWADAARVPVVLVMEENGNPHEHGMLSQIAAFREPTLPDGLATVISLLNRWSKS